MRAFPGFLPAQICYARKLPSEYRSVTLYAPAANNNNSGSELNLYNLVPFLRGIFFRRPGNLAKNKKIVYYVCAGLNYSSRPFLATCAVFIAPHQLKIDYELQLPRVR